MDERAPLLTVAQLADALQVPAEVIVQWRLEDRGPPPVEGDGVPRWRPQDVRDWLADRLAAEQFRPPVDGH